MIDDGKRQNLNFLRLEQAFWELPKPRTILRPCTFQWNRLKPSSIFVCGVLMFKEKIKGRNQIKIHEIQC